MQLASCIDTTPDWPTVRAQAAGYIATEYASLDRAGAPITWPVTPYLGATGETIDVSTGLTYPLKAERARRNPKVAVAFTHPTGCGLNAPATFVVQGLATVRDADLRANSARYLVQSSNRFPEAYASIPRPMLRAMAFYWVRIWVEITPVRVLWWRDGLDEAPQLWRPPTEVAVRQSDPAPAGRNAGSWNTSRTVPWQRRVRGALDRLGMPVLTTVDPRGWPLPLPVREAEPTATGFRVRLPAGVAVDAGPACLTFHTHGEVFDGQDNVTVVGHCRYALSHGDGVVEFHAERALNDFTVPTNPVLRMAHILNARQKLRRRLDAEASRRGQRVPSFDELGLRSVLCPA